MGALTAAGANYVIPAGKEVLVVAFNTCATERTVATTDNVGIIEYQGAMSNGNWPSGESQVILDCPYYTGSHAISSIPSYYNVHQLLSVHILSRNWNADATPVNLVSNNTGAYTCFISPGFAIGLSGNGRIWLYDPDATDDFSMYVFER